MLAVEQQGEDVAAGIYAKIVFTATIAGQMYTLDGVHDIGANASNGTHTVTWTPPADIRAKATECTMTATLSATDNPSGDDYIYYIGVFPVIQNPFAAVGMRRSRVPVGWWCVGGRGAASSPSPFPFT
jgi:hypothetical protein